jgi:Holliday junction DNA helicase RuvA
MVLELAGKLADVGGPARPRGSAARDEVAAALVGLGWSSAQADKALDAVQADDAAPSDVPGLLRAALRGLGGDRG